MGRGRKNLELARHASRHLQVHGIEHRGTNSYGRPISVITLETEKGVNMYYAPASLYWDLKRRPGTSFLKYEGTQTSDKGYDYPVFKFAK